MYFTRSKVTLVIVILFTVKLESSICLKRNLDFTFNENCNDKCKNTEVKLAHIKATGPNDTIHYLWDFTKKPSLLLAVTKPSAQLQISWDDYLARNLKKALSFTEKPIYTFGIAIERLFEFNDVEDKARIDLISNQSNIYELKLKNFKWHHKDMFKNDDYVQFYVEADTYKDTLLNETRDGSLNFTMHTFGKHDHSHVMPRLLHSENVTQLDIILNNLETKKEFSNSRFAFELLLVSENDAKSTFTIDAKKKLDDEFTPGIFEVMELVTPFVADKTAFLQWRPISYIASERDVTNSTGIVFYPLKKPTINNLFDKDDILYLYYGDDIENNLLQRMNVSFGTSKDGFYNENHYNSWTFIIGYGQPLEERFSKIAIIIIGVVVGVSAVILLMSAIYICTRRTQRNNGERLR